jgi:hypothetical protein
LDLDVRALRSELVEVPDVEQPLGCGLGDASQTGRLLGPEAWRVVTQPLEEPLGLRKGVERLARERERHAQPLAQVAANAGGLASRAPGRDDRPGGALVGGLEEHGALAVVAALELGNHRIPLSDGREALPGVVERDDPRDLSQSQLGRGVANVELHGHRTIGVLLAQDRARVSVPTVDREGQPHGTVEGRARVGPEAELGRGPQRKRTARNDLPERRHVRAGQPSLTSTFARPWIVSIP